VIGCIAASYGRTRTGAEATYARDAMIERMTNMEPAHEPPGSPLGPVQALRRVASLLEQMGESTYRSRAFRAAAATLAAVPPEELRARAAAGTLRQLRGLGEVTAAVAAEALAGEVPRYLAKLEEQAASLPPREGAALLAALRGDCHVHSEWSDGTVPIREMAEAARDLGHDYMVLTDHSPTLRIANGLSPERLREQLDVVRALNQEFAPFRILTGIEVDILLDGALDQEDELLARLDVVVGSVHSKLRMEYEEMTVRMLAAVANPHLDILGHCTGRMRTRRRDRPESTFDAQRVFEACMRYNKAVEINSLPERRDPPSRLMRQALEIGCRFAIDSDGHAPGHLDLKALGCDRAAACEVPAERVVNTLDADALLAWTRSHDDTQHARRYA
jgi:putative hydrolase